MFVAESFAHRPFDLTHSVEVPLSPLCCSWTSGAQKGFRGAEPEHFVGGTLAVDFNKPFDTLNAKHDTSALTSAQVEEVTNALYLPHCPKLIEHKPMPRGLGFPLAQNLIGDGLQDDGVYRPDALGQNRILEIGKA